MSKVKLPVRDTDLPQLSQLLRGLICTCDDDDLLAMMRRVLKEVEHHMRVDGREVPPQ